MALIMVVTGGLFFVLAVPFAINLAINGPTYDMRIVKYNVTKTEVLRPAQTLILGEGSSSLALNFSLVQPIGPNYNISGTAWGNSSFALMLFDQANYNLYLQKGAYQPLASTSSLLGENKSFAIRLPNAIILYIVVEHRNPERTLQFTFKLNHSYLGQDTKAEKELNMLWTLVVPGICFIGLITMIIGFFVLRGEARSAQALASQEPASGSYEGE